MYRKRRGPSTRSAPKRLILTSKRPILLLASAMHREPRDIRTRKVTKTRKTRRDKWKISDFAPARKMVAFPAARVCHRLTRGATFETRELGLVANTLVIFRRCQRTFSTSPNRTYRKIRRYNAWCDFMLPESKHLPRDRSADPQKTLRTATSKRIDTGQPLNFRSLVSVSPDHPDVYDSPFQTGLSRCTVRSRSRYFQTSS